MLAWLNDFSMAGPFLLKSIIITMIIACSSLVINKFSWKDEHDDDE